MTSTNPVVANALKAKARNATIGKGFADELKLAFAVATKDGKADIAAKLKRLATEKKAQAAQIATREGYAGAELDDVVRKWQAEADKLLADAIARI